MPSMDVTQNIAANGDTSLLVNQQYEYLPYDAFVEVAVIGKASGTNAPNLKATIYSGSDLLVQSGDIPPLASTDALTVQYPESFIYSDAAFTGERLSILVQNLSANAGEVRAVVRITPSG